jgi:hypothetical protein
MICYPFLDLRIPQLNTLLQGIRGDSLSERALQVLNRLGLFFEEHAPMGKFLQFAFVLMMSTLPVGAELLQVDLSIHGMD